MDKVLPDTGLIAHIIENLTNKHPLKTFGKPNTDMILPILNKFKKNEIVFIGDSLDTDAILAKDSDVDFIHLAKNGHISNLGVLIDYFNYSN